MLQNQRDTYCRIRDALQLQMKLQLQIDYLCSYSSTNPGCASQEWPAGWRAERNSSDGVLSLFSDTRICRNRGRDVLRLTQAQDLVGTAWEGSTNRYNVKTVGGWGNTSNSSWGTNGKGTEATPPLKKNWINVPPDKNESMEKHEIGQIVDRGNTSSSWKGKKNCRNMLPGVNEGMKKHEIGQLNLSWI